MRSVSYDYSEIVGVRISYDAIFGRWWWRFRHRELKVVKCAKKVTLSPSKIPAKYCLNRNSSDSNNLFLPDNFNEFKVEIYETELIITCNASSEDDMLKALSHFTTASKISFSKYTGIRARLYFTVHLLKCQHGYRATNKYKLQAR